MQLVKYLLNYPGMRFVLSERFNQDPIESHFGKHRQMKGGNDNPTVAQFNQNESVLRLLGSQALAPVPQTMVLLFQKLLKIRRYRNEKGNENFTDIVQVYFLVIIYVY